MDMNPARVNQINKQLLDIYGYFDASSKDPKYRLVWSPDQIEKRMVTHTPGGVLLLYPELSEVPKYKQWADECWVVEVLVVVPTGVETDLTTKTSYEPLWVFRGVDHVPSWEAVDTIIQTRLNNMRLAGQYVKYKEHRETREEYENRITELQKEIFGDITAVEIALATGSGVSLANTRKETVN